MTRNGRAWYVGTRLVDPDLDRLVGQVCAAAGVAPVVAGAPPDLEAVRRLGADGTRYLFLINHAESPATLPAGGTDLLTGTSCPGEVTVPAGGVVVLREDPLPEGGEK